MARPEVVREIVRLSGRETPRVLYLGTAKYDEAEAQARQCAGLQAHGCTITALPIAVESPSLEVAKAAMDGADVVLFSGGNTLFAHDRLVKLGIDRLLREALARGAVLCGGSAGAIIWCDGGHSDSRDPATFKNPKPDLSDEEKKAWDYIRVPGLGFLPGLCCPHHDKVQSNGMLRATDFDGMMRRHAGEVGLCIDNDAAFVVEDEEFRVVAPDGCIGSVGSGGEFLADRSGRPGVWRKAVDSASGEVQRTLLPERGRLADVVAPAASIVEDPALPAARAENPDDGKPPGGLSQDPV